MGMQHKVGNHSHYYLRPDDSTPVQLPGKQVGNASAARIIVWKGSRLMSPVSGMSREPPWPKMVFGPRTPSSTSW